MFENMTEKILMITRTFVRRDLYTSEKYSGRKKCRHIEVQHTASHY